jgi:ribosomal protein S18 acetylase RimI-like enzyme
MIEFRTATEADLPAIVRLLADDPLGATRERDEAPLPEAYVEAFEAIRAQTGNEIIVAVDGGAVVGCLQFTVIPGLARLGMRRGQIEGVRVDKRYRSKGVGEILFRHAIERARDAGCGLVQLTTDKSRPDALRFYERLGFVASHEGMKLVL